MKFITRKFITLSSALIFGGIAVVTFALFVKNKPLQEKISNFNVSSNVDYKSWAKDRVNAANQQGKKRITRHLAATSNNDQELAAVKLTIPNPKDPSNPKPAISISGVPIYRYGRSIFAIDDNEKKQKSNKFYDLGNRLGAAQMLARILQVAGYRPQKAAQNPGYTVSAKDAIDYVGKFLNENQPFYGPTLSFNPISILNELSDNDYFRNQSYYDDRAFNNDGAAVPEIGLVNLFGDTLDLFLRKNYSPNSLEKTLSEDTKWANALNNVIISDGHNPMNTNFLFNFSSETKVALTLLMQDFFAANNEQGQFAQSYIYQQLTKQENSNLVFEVLGDVKEIEKNYAKYMQKLAISMIQNLKFSLLKLSNVQITKLTLANNKYKGNNQVLYGPRLTNSSSTKGYKKNIYDAFKNEVLTNETAQKRIFGYLKDDTKTFLSNIELGALMEDEYSGFEQAKNEYKTVGQFVYHPTYTLRSCSEVIIGSNPLSFSLISFNLPFTPVLFNPKTGIYEQDGVITDKLSVVGSHTGPYTDHNQDDIVVVSKNSTGKADQIVFVNKWFKNSFSIKDDYYAADSNKIASQSSSNLQTSPSYQQKEFQSYLIKNKSQGMNIFTSQFYYVIRALAEQQINFYNDVNNQTKLMDKDHDPFEETTINKFRLDNLMQNVYTSFTNQSRAKVLYYLDKDDKEVLESEPQKIVFDNKNQTPKTSKIFDYAANSLANAYTFYSICLEIFKNVSDFASANPEYNKLGTKQGIMHWTSIDDFNEAFIFYMVQLGGSRRYVFKDSYLSQYNTQLSTVQVNRYAGADSLTLDGKRFAYQPKLDYLNDINGLFSYGRYEGVVNTIASLLNYPFGQQEFYNNYEDGQKTTKIAQQEVIDLSSSFFYHLSVIQKYHQINLFGENGQLTETGEKFIKVYEQEVLGSKYFLSQLLFNSGVDGFGNMFGYLKANEKIDSITNQLTHKTLESFTIQPDVKWSSQLGRLDNQTFNLNGNEKSINEQKSWVIPGFSFGIFKNTDFIANQNLTSTINPIKFNSKSLLDISLVNHFFALPNGTSKLFSPIEFQYNQAKKEIAILINKNWLIPN